MSQVGFVICEYRSIQGLCLVNHLAVYHGGVSLAADRRALKVTGATKIARMNVIKTYRDMITMVNALLVVSPEVDLIRFAMHVNELITKKQIAIKSKKTKAANAAANQVDSDEEGIDVL